MTTTWRTAAAVAVLGLLTCGCLVKEERHTWYLDAASGAVTWTVFEHDVRSNAKTPADRVKEESTFWVGVQAETHATARGLRALGASTVRTRILRGEVPFSIVTDATLSTIDELGRRLITGSGAIGTSVLERDGDALIWTMTMREEHSEPEQEPDDDVEGLLWGLETLRVVLAQGRFQSAVGFDLGGDHRVAIFDEKIFADANEDTEIVLRLRWVMSDFH